MKKKLFTFFILIVILSSCIFCCLYFDIFSTNSDSPLEDLNKVENNNENYLVDIEEKNENSQIEYVLNFIDKINKGEIMYYNNYGYIVLPSFGKFSVNEGPIIVDSLLKIAVGYKTIIKVITADYEYEIIDISNDIKEYEDYSFPVELEVENKILKGKTTSEENFYEVSYLNKFEQVYKTGEVNFMKDCILECNKNDDIITLDLIYNSKIYYSFQTDGKSFAKVFEESNLVCEMFFDKAELVNEKIEIIKKYDFMTDNDMAKLKNEYNQITEDCKKRLQQYIEDQKPKNETYDVETVDDFKSSNSLNYDSDDNVVKLYWSISGKINSEQTINVTLGLTIEMSDDVMTTTDDNGVKTVRIVADESNVVATTRGKTDVKPAVKDLSLDVVMVIKSDMSVTCQYSASLKYESEELSFNQEVNITESGKILDKFIDVESLNSVVKGKITDLVVLDAYNNSYINKETSYEFAGEDSVVTLIAYYLYK